MGGDPVGGGGHAGLPGKRTGRGTGNSLDEMASQREDPFQTQLRAGQPDTAA